MKHDASPLAIVLKAGNEARPLPPEDRQFDLSYGQAPCPFGLCRIASSPHGICHLSFADRECDPSPIGEIRRLWPQARIAADTTRTRPLVNSIFDRNNSVSPPPALLLYGTPFQIAVWRALLDIPAGATVSYGGLAASLGRPGASRAVGTAAGANRIAWLIPCHRVLRADGATGGYRWGTGRKRAMLEWEEHANA